MPAPPEWNRANAYCGHCAQVKAELQGAREKIQRLEARLVRQQAHWEDVVSRRRSSISPTARMASIWAQQNEERSQ